MKIHHGFVSNSSTTSFVCVVCGKTENEMDCYMAPETWAVCKHGHLVCDTHLESFKTEITESGGHPYRMLLDCPICKAIRTILCGKHYSRLANNHSGDSDWENEKCVLCKEQNKKRGRKKK